MIDTQFNSSLRFASHSHHRLSYELITPNTPSTETIVLLHSLLSGRGEFAALRSLLAGQFRLILPDARGHGASAAIPDQRYTIQIAASELDAILDDAGETSVHLLGHDLGGAVAFAYACIRPQRVQTLTLIDPALPNLLAGETDPTVATVYDESQRADALAADTAYKGVTDRAVDQYLTPRSGPDWRTTASKPAIGTIRRHAAALAGCLTAISSYTPDTDKITALAIPATIYTTVSARPINRFINQRLAGLIPGADLVDLPAGNAGDPLRSPLSGAAADTIAQTLLNRSPRR